MTKKQIGSVIKKRRTELNLTQKQFAEKIKMPFQHIPNIENGNTNMTIDSLERILRALELEMSIEPKP